MNNETRKFTAEEVNRIVEQRIARERKNNENYAKIKQIVKALREMGITEAESPEKLAQELKALFDAQSGENAVLTEQSAEVPKDETEAAEPKETKEAKEANEIAAPEDAGKTKDDEIQSRMTAELYELSEKYPSLDVSELFADTDFIKLYGELSAENPRISLVGAYEAFLLAKKLEREHKIRNDMKTTPSGSSSVSELLLTPNQRQIAKHAGMSYKEYAKLLSEIPSKKIR